MEQDQQLLHSVSMDLLHQRAEHCLNIYRAHAEVLFPLSEILLLVITKSNVLRSSAPLWNDSSQGAIVSSHYGLVRVLNEVTTYFERMGVCDHMEPLKLPSVEDTSPVTGQFHEAALALHAPCFLYDNLYLPHLSQSRRPTMEPFYKRLLSYIFPASYYPNSSQFQKDAILEHKKNCLRLILSNIINANLPHEPSHHILVILATVSASSFSAKSTIFLSSTQHNHNPALLIIPGPVPRKEIIVPNLQIVRSAGQIPPVDVREHANTLLFTSAESTLGPFSRRNTIPWQVISPSYTGILLPFMRKESGVRGWTSLTKAVHTYHSPILTKLLKNASHVLSTKRQKVSLQKTQRKPSFSFKPASSRNGLFTTRFSTRRSTSAETKKFRRALNAHRGYLFCCRMSPGEYDAHTPFQTRTPLALLQHSPPYLRVKKQFAPYLANSSSEPKAYVFTVQLRLPDTFDSTSTMYIAQVSIHFSGARGTILASDSLEPLPIPCTCDLPVGKFLTNKDVCTEYGLYNLHTQQIEWQSSGIKRHSDNTTSCVSLSVQYRSQDSSEAVVYPVVEVSIDSSIVPDIVYITDVTL